ncbi:hypothetical protein VQ643_16130, partial [Pseudomonas sp. F1_0610]
MSELFFTEYLTSFPTLNFNRKFVKGYSSSEILKIEKLYGVNIGQGTELYAFLNNLGRCSGGLLGSDPLVFYKKNFSVRQHILLQSKYFYQISRKNFEFTIAVENEVEYYYLLSEDQLV